MARARTSADDLGMAAVADLVAALEGVGVRVERSGPRALEAWLDGTRCDLDVVPAAYATGTRVDELVGGRTSGGVAVLVADRITADAKQRLSEAGWGWFDRRGHLRLRSPGLLLDTSVPAVSRAGQAPVEPIRGRAGISIAYRLLTDPETPVSTTGSKLAFAPSTISEALSRLRDAGLVDDEGLGVVPDLFWALADRWAPERTWLAEEPDPVAADTTGWCVSGTVAATELGAPMVSTDATPDLYVPGPVVVTIAARRYGVARDASVAAASIAVAPASEVTSRAQPSVDQPWPVAHPVAVALDLAQDRARGREVLHEWSPAERVW